MKKIFIALFIFSLVGMQAFCESDKPFFYQTETSDELYTTGEVSSYSVLFSSGKHQNTAISPNVFSSYGIYQKSSKISQLEKFGSIVFNNQSYMAVLIPDNVTSGFNYYTRINPSILYPLTIPIDSRKFMLTVSPYVRADVMFGIYPEIVNISIQSFFSLNCGANITGIYQLTDEIRLGSEFSSFLIGMDTGRDGYNKEYIPDIVFSHFGNYLDLQLDLFCEFDVSRLKSVRIEYSHAANSYYGGTYSVISGDNRLGISFVQKLVR